MERLRQHVEHRHFRCARTRLPLSPLAAAAGAPAAWRGSQCSRRSRATGVVLSKLVLDLTWTRPNILSNEIK
jgi:hypothetical protein